MAAPLLSFRTALILCLLAGVLLLSTAGLFLIVYLRSDGSGSRVEVIAPPVTQPVSTPDTIPPAPPPVDDLAIGMVTTDPSGRYAFPIAADPALYTWTHFHWNGTHSVDIEARFGLSYAEFMQVTSAPVVAFTSGTARIYSGSIGGQGYMLQGDDGFDYYYAHLSDLWVADGTHVTAGQTLGRMGNTGSAAQFIEPHLHFAIGPRDTIWDAPPSINGAEHLHALFGLDWVERPIPYVAADTPGGWPAYVPGLTILTAFANAEAHGLAQPAVEFGFPGDPPDSSINVHATLDGVVNVIRWTGHYGTRIQINNDAARFAVVISGLDAWLVQDGDVVSQGDIIGRWNLASRPRLNYMIFDNGVIIDPAYTLDR